MLLRKGFQFFLIFIFMSSLINAGEPKNSYITTIHPFQEILKRIVGEQGTVTAILPPGSSPHTFELRPSDVRKVSQAKALFIGGKNLDDWALKFESIHPTNGRPIELISLLPEKNLLYIKNNIDNQTKILGIDPHFWTDPLTVKALLPKLTDKLCAIDPARSEIYHKNRDVFSEQLDSLYLEIDQMLKPIQGKSVMLSHPFFQYFLERFNIKLVNSIELIPGKEPTPKEIKRLIQQAQKTDVQAIFDHSQLPEMAAKVIAEAAGIKIHQLDPLGGRKNSQTYEQLLYFNAQQLLKALK